MHPIGAAVIALVVSWVSVDSAWGIEFMADQITRINGHSHKASVLYRDDMWRLEHSDAGPVNVTIVRKDMQVMWFLLARMKHFKTLPYDPEQAPRVSERLEGEFTREVVGTEILEGHPTTLYEVTTREQDKDVTYYQWLATDIRFPLRLARKDGSWTVEYRNVKLRTLPASLFQIPLSYLPLEEWERVKHDGPSKLPM